MKPTTIIISAVLASIFIAGFMGLVTSLNNNYGNTADTGDLVKINTLNNSYNFATNFSGEVQNQPPQTTQTGLTATSFTDRMWNSVKILFNSLTYIPNMILVAGDILHIPDYMVYAFLGIVILTLTLGILALIGIIPYRP